MPPLGKKSLGMTLIEVIIVVALLASVMAIAMPQMFQTTEAEVQSKLNRLSSDFRSAYDVAVLTGRTHRLCFQPLTGDYWLDEGPLGSLFKLGDAKMERDMTKEEEDKQREELIEQFDTEYAELAGETFKDPEEPEKEIKPTSPVLKAKEKLLPPRWQQVTSMEWGPRTLGSKLMVTEMQAEHHSQKQTFEELGEQGIACIYAFPTGYVERAYLRIAYTLDPGVPDLVKQPYVMKSHSYTGTMTQESNDIEIDVHGGGDEE